MKLSALIVTTATMLLCASTAASSDQMNPTEELSTPEAWSLAFMLQYAPLNRPNYIPEAQETPEERLERYQSIAEDIREVVWSENPIFGGGRYARTRTAAVILSLMFFEGGFRKDVDYGIGKRARGDHGRSWCLMQIQVGTGRTIAWNHAKRRYATRLDPPEEVEPGYTGEEMVSDRKKCIRAGIRALRGSCGPTPYKRLQAYASGTCEGERGQKESFHRMSLAMKWFDRHKPVWSTDDDFILPIPEQQSPEPPHPNLNDIAIPDLIRLPYRVAIPYLSNPTIRVSLLP